MSDTEIALQTHYQPCFNYAKFSGQRPRQEKPGERHLKFLAGVPVPKEQQSEEELLALRLKYGRIQFICRHEKTGICRISSIRNGAEVIDMLKLNRLGMEKSWEVKLNPDRRLRKQTVMETMRDLCGGPERVRTLLGYAFRARNSWQIIDVRPITWTESEMSTKGWNQAFLCRFLLDNFPDRFSVRRKQYAGVELDLKSPQGYRQIESVLDMSMLMPWK